MVYAMNHVRLRFIFFFAVLALAASCSKPKSSAVVSSSPTPPPSPTPASATTSPAADNFACTLLTKDETQAVQGEPFKNTKASDHSAAGLVVSQCYFELPTAVNSIVLTVTRKAEGGRDPSDSWREIFYREESARKKEEGEEEKKPLKVDGLGDEAFWTGTRVGGALYVLKGNCYIRISVGGAGDQERKIEKSKTLAAMVLKRL
ncbi:MAG TPA: hypothetical protein VLH83_02375 [Chthoniobacterales bacterium]|nr:hypothetical protein [Chthoniobacterales bacterium]